MSSKDAGSNAARNLLDATRELKSDDLLREALGRRRDEDYVDYFIRVKQDEWRATTSK